MNYIVFDNILNLKKLNIIDLLFNKTNNEMHIYKENKFFSKIDKKNIYIPMNINKNIKYNTSTNYIFNILIKHITEYVSKINNNNIKIINFNMNNNLIEMIQNKLNIDIVSSNVVINYTTKIHTKDIVIIYYNYNMYAINIIKKIIDDHNPKLVIIIGDIGFKYIPYNFLQNIAIEYIDYFTDDKNQKQITEDKKISFNLMHNI